MVAKILLITALLLAATFFSNAKGLIVIANTAKSIEIDKRQVRDIFMSTNTVYNLKPVIPRPQDTARLTFNLKVVGLTESRIQSYWAQMRFAGRRQPPQEFSSVEERIRFVQNNINTVTYLQHDAEIPEGLTVIYETK